MGEGAAAAEEKGLAKAGAVDASAIRGSENKEGACTIAARFAGGRLGAAAEARAGAVGIMTGMRVGGQRAAD